MDDATEARRRIREFLLQEMGVSAHALSDGTPLFEAGILDSVSLVALVAFCEEHLACQVPVEEITYEAFRSIDSTAERVVTRWRAS